MSTESTMEHENNESFVTSDEESDDDSDNPLQSASSPSSLSQQLEQVSNHKKKLHPIATPEQLLLLSPIPFTEYNNLHSSQWFSVTDDGGVLQYNVNNINNNDSDASECVELLSHVYLLIRGISSSGEEFLSNHFIDNEIDIVLGQASLPKGLEIALCSMIVGQHSVIAIDVSKDYGYSSTRLPESLKNKKNDNLYFDLKVRRYEKEKNLHTMNFQEKLEFIKKRRIIGKELFLNNEPISALKQYEKGLTVLETINSNPNFSLTENVAIQAIKNKNNKNNLNTQQTIKELNEINELIIIMLINSAQCKAKINDWISVLTLTNQILLLKPNHRKALHRRATAHYKREEWEEAKKDFKTLLALNNENDSNLNSNDNDNNNSINDADDQLSADVIAQINRQLIIINEKQKIQHNAEKKKWNGFLLDNNNNNNKKNSNNKNSTGQSKLSFYDDVIKENEEKNSFMNKFKFYEILQHLQSFTKFLFNQTRNYCRNYNKNEKNKND